MWCQPSVRRSLRAFIIISGIRGSRRFSNGCIKPDCNSPEKKRDWLWALLLLASAAQGMVIMKFELEDVIDASRALAKNFLDSSPERPNFFGIIFSRCGQAARRRIIGYILAIAICSRLLTAS